MPLEVLHLPFMFLRRRTAAESAQVLPFVRLRIHLPRIQPIFPRAQLSNHPSHSFRVTRLIAANPIPIHFTSAHLSLADRDRAFLLISSSDAITGSLAISE